MTSSYLYLVDLAGSERVKKTKAVEMRLEEAKKINLSSLFSLILLKVVIINSFFPKDFNSLFEFSCRL